jgi:thiol-disulfide isomerase/thioredoxin
MAPQLRLVLLLAACLPARGAFEAVRELTSLNFRNVVADPSSAVLVAFVAPWCPHSQALRPAYDALGRHFADAAAASEAQRGKAAAVAAPSGASPGAVNTEDVVIARCDATLEPDLASAYGVAGYPTLLWFGPGSQGRAEPYGGGEVTTAAMAWWVEERTGLAVTGGMAGSHGYAPYRDPVPAAVALTVGTFDAVVYDPSRTVK